MNDDDAVSLRSAWTADASASNEDLPATVQAVLFRDRALRARERRTRIAGIVALASLLPVLVWSGAHGVTPLIRGAYAMMAVGCGLLVAAEWLYLDWSSQSLPGPRDARSQLQKTSFMLARQARLVRMAPLWSSPIFIGAALIALWMYRERTHAGALAVAVITVGVWIVSGRAAWSVSARLDHQRRAMVHMLNELR
jgi:hypothetical protein